MKPGFDSQLGILTNLYIIFFDVIWISLKNQRKYHVQKVELPGDFLWISKKISYTKGGITWGFSLNFKENIIYKRWNYLEIFFELQRKNHIQKVETRGGHSPGNSTKWPIFFAFLQELSRPKNHVFSAWRQKHYIQQIYKCLYCCCCLEMRNVNKVDCGL